jgi:hypothetical protein
MPRGTRHRLTGLLFEGTRDPVLRVDGGGEWRLDLDRPYRALLGRRVVVDGVRSGFDLLAVERIWLQSAPEPPRRVGLWARLSQLLGR